MTDASTIRPLRMRYIQRPTNRAMGMVQAIVNVPQLLPGMTWTLPLGSVYWVGVGVVANPMVTPSGINSTSGTGARTRKDSDRLLSVAPPGYRTVQLGGKTSSVDFSPAGIISAIVPAGVVTTVPASSFASSPPRALTTTKANPARATTTITRIASEATTDAGFPNSARAISASDFPPRRTEAAIT